MKYPKVCDKALDKIDKIKQNETEFLDCLKYKICPRCGENLEEKARNFECLECEFKWCNGFEN